MHISSKPDRYLAVRMKNFAVLRVLGQTVSYLVAYEVEIGTWEPLGVIEVADWEMLGISIARLSWEVLPGVFRLIELEGPDWFEVELAADGILFEP
jgi:hypothetical protein